MSKRTSARYELVTTDNQLDHTHKASVTNREVNTAKSTAPRRVESGRSAKIFGASFDLVVGAGSLLFTAYGFLVYTYRGEPVYPGSKAATIVSVARYVRFSVPSNSWND